MANEILKLKDIGTKEVAKLTNIESIYIDYMIDKNFEKLTHVNAVAYAKIITREYGLNLEDWVEEYKAFLNENKDSNANNIVVNPKLPSYTSPDKNGGFGWIILVIIAIAVFVWLFGFTKYFDGLWELIEDKNTSEKISVSYSNTTIVEETKEKLSQNNTMPLKIEINEVELNTTEMNASQIEANVTALAVDIAPKIENNVSNLEENATNSFKLEVEAMGESKDSTGVAIFHPKKNIWIGIKELMTMQKRSFSRNVTFDLNLSKDMLVRTGHGLFEVETPDKNYTYNTRDPQIFLIKGGKIRPLSFDEYVEINKGKVW